MTKDQAISEMIGCILCAGFDAQSRNGVRLTVGNPWFVTIYDRDGNPLWIDPKTLGPFEIIGQVRKMFGNQAARDCARFPALRVH